MKQCSSKMRGGNNDSGGRCEHTFHPVPRFIKDPSIPPPFRLLLPQSVHSRSPRARLSERTSSALPKSVGGAPRGWGHLSLPKLCLLVSPGVGGDFPLRAV